MSNRTNSFPFPVKEQAIDDLLRDVCIRKINKNDFTEIIDVAWNIGVKAAIELKSKHTLPYDFKKIATQEGLIIIDKDKDYIVGNTRYFSEFISGQSEITMYKKSITYWAEMHRLEYSTAYNYILAHEFFHFLEWNQLGLTSRKFQVPMIKIGQWSFGKTGIKAMSEIGANAFVHELFLGGKL